MRFAAALSILLALSRISSATDIESLSGRELRQYCLAYVEEPGSEAGKLCAAYVGGFVAGLTASNSVVVSNAKPARESFTDRALRTRLGVRPSEQPAACLADSTSLHELIGQLLAQAEEQPPAEDADASEILTSALRRFHPCSIASGASL